MRDDKMNRRQFMSGVIASGAALRAAAAVSHGPDSGSGKQAVARDDGRDLQALLRSTVVVDGLDPMALTEGSLELLKAGSVTCWHRGGGDVAAFATLLSFCDQHRDKIVPATSVREILEAHRSGKIAHISGWQSAEVLIVEGAGKPQIESLRAYQQLGLRVCGIAYNIANVFGSGCAEPHLGITRAGRRLVEEIHRNRIILDVGGHAGEQTSLDALEMSAGLPVVCTHTNVRALVDNPRNTTDRVFQAIAKTGGVIGITAFNDFHSRTRGDAAVQHVLQVSLEKHLDNYDYLKRLVGVDHIGLGPDFVTGREYDHQPGTLDRARMPVEIYSDTPWLYVKGFENISELPNVAMGLLRRGWTPQEIRKVLGENWLRVYEKVWGA